MKTLFMLCIAFLLSASVWAISPLQFNPLPYDYNALEPYIDAQTMEIHYSRHHKGYFDNLVKAIAGSDLADQSLEEILSKVSSLSVTIRNNAGGHYNHTFFWESLSPNGGGSPSGVLAEKINATFGSFAAFQTAFKQAALSRFGSGWAWLCVAEDGTLFISSTANQDNPLMDIAEKKGIPLLGLDVWEHAYYLKYQNQRAVYVDNFWSVVNWQEVSSRLEKTGK